MKRSWNTLSQLSNGVYAVQDFERAAYRLVVEQVLYAGDRGTRLAYHLVEDHFDDFIAAGEYLIEQGITPKCGLTVQGGSNGGLLVGAVVNQRPDLFAAGNAAVGVMDMLRFDRFTAGRYWVDDYGYPGKEADFRVLRAYSPYHNIRSGVDYPATLVTTADTDDADDRVTLGAQGNVLTRLRGRLGLEALSPALARPNT